MKKIAIVSIICMLFSAIFLSGCIDGEDDSALSNLGYSNTLYGFGLNPPADWTVDESNPDVIVTFIGPSYGNGTVNLMINAGQLETGKTLYGTVMDLEFEFIDVYFGEYTINSVTNRTINDMNACEIVYTIVQNGDQGRQKQVWIEKSRKALVLAYTAYLDIFDTYNTVFEESLSSVVIIW